MNLWRIMRDELKLCNYSFENCAAHILGKRFPTFPSYVKTRWFHSTIHVAGGLCSQIAAKQQNEKIGASSSAPSSVSRTTGYSGNGLYRVLNHHLERCMANIEIVDQLDLIGRTAEVRLDQQTPDTASLRTGVQSLTVSSSRSRSLSL
jgi:hypothetical protein